MNRTNVTYRPLGEFIRKVDCRNNALKISKLVGLTIEKSFIPSVANVIGTDLSNYKIIRKGQFACSLMQVSRDGKMPIAMFTDDEAIMSPAYPMFEVVDTNRLLPEFLMMWFSRSEFDRESSYYAVGGVRGSLEWDDFCAMKIPVPPIEEQHRIVEQYNAVQRRIDIQTKLITKLQDTAQALYKKTFVDGIDKDHLPDGWRMGTLTDIADFMNGTACQSYATEDSNSMPVLKIRELTQGRCDANSDKVSKNIPQMFWITKGDIIFSWSATLMIDIWCDVDCALNQHLFKVTPNNYPKWYCFLWIQSHIDEWKNFISAKATSMGHIKREDLEKAEVIIPSKFDLQKMNDAFEPVFKNIYNTKQEVLKLKELQTIILSKLGR